MTYQPPRVVVTPLARARAPWHAGGELLRAEQPEAEVNLALEETRPGSELEAELGSAATSCGSPPADGGGQRGAESLQRGVTSINEELQSTNEELETSKEELQSLNEELQTINVELEAKSMSWRAHQQPEQPAQQHRYRDPFLDPALRIRWFTPCIKALLELLPSDIGRSIGHFAQRFSGGDLLEDARRCSSGCCLPRPKWRTNGPVVIRHILPYRTQDNRIAGVVVTFVDITERKQTADARSTRRGILCRNHRPGGALSPRRPHT